jgi:hypothetical protein
VNLKNGKVFTSKSVGTGPSSCGKRIYWAAVSQRFRNTALDYMEPVLWERISGKIFVLHAVSVPLS